MASVAVRRQVMMTVWAEAFISMLWDQRYRKQERNTVFAGMRLRLLQQCDYIRALLAMEPGGKLNLKESTKAARAVQELKRHAFRDGLFEPMMALSFIIDQVVEQLTFVRGNAAKKRAFDGLLYRIKEFERYFDRTKTYDDPAGMEAAETFRTLEI